jgi:hypothetical protein
MICRLFCLSARHPEHTKTADPFQEYDMVIYDEFVYVSCDKEGGELLFNHLSFGAGKNNDHINKSGLR